MAALGRPVEFLAAKRRSLPRQALVICCDAFLAVSAVNCHPASLFRKIVFAMAEPRRSAFSYSNAWRQELITSTRFTSDMTILKASPISAIGRRLSATDTRTSVTDYRTSLPFAATQYRPLLRDSPWRIGSPRLRLRISGVHSSPLQTFRSA